MLRHAAAVAIRARVAAVVDVALAAIEVTATVILMNEGGRFHRRHLLAEARRHLALVLRGRRHDPGLDDRIVAAAISTHRLNISEPKTARGLEADYRLYTRPDRHPRPILRDRRRCLGERCRRPARSRPRRQDHGH
ncbi:hypothetical protein [Streptomyces sp. NPDC058291]|uniref:hypothetical protein n=1 Tax=Streptomyces sp. NPDC058291 TaxID=3346427 RepID=UPI0036EA6EEB